MTHSIASGTAHAVTKLHTDIWQAIPDSLYSSGSGEVQAVAACTEHGKDKLNIVHFLYNCSISTILNTNLSDNVYLFLPHLLASVFGHLYGVCCSYMCSLYGNVFGKSLHI
jgi:hypothetical protein